MMNKRNCDGQRLEISRAGETERTKMAGRPGLDIYMYIYMYV